MEKRHGSLAKVGTPFRASKEEEKERIVGIRKMEENKRQVLVTLTVSDPVESSSQPGLFTTKLTHPNLTGELLLLHGADREALLKAVATDLKEVDPVSSMFKGLRELSERV
jgi:hypothetical protein